MECGTKEEREENKALLFFFPARIFLRRPHKLNAWNRLLKITTTVVHMIDPLDTPYKIKSNIY